MKEKLLEQKPDPERDGELAPADEFGWRRCGHDARHRVAITGGLIASPFMNTTANDDFPFDLFRILGAGKITKGLAAGGATTLCFGRFMDLFDRGKILMTFSAMSWAASC